jgi:hypothetical protein
VNREYVITDLADDLVEDFATLQAIGKALKAIDDKAFGYRTVLLRLPEDFAEHGIDEALYTAHTGGRLPVIYVGMAYLPGRFDVARLKPIEDKYGLTLLRESE